MGKHVVEAEELQAYLDRELGPARQAEVERHLRECRECAALVADLQRVSATLQEWQVERAPASLRPPAMEAAEAKPRWAWPRFSLALAGGAVVILLVAAISIPNLLRSRMAREQAENKVTGLSSPAPASQPARPAPAVPPKRTPSAPAEGRSRQVVELPEDYAAKDEALLKEEEKAMAALRAESADRVGTLSAASPAAAQKAAAQRLIAYEVTMTIEVKEFGSAKEKLLKVVEQAGGYVAQASAAETPDQPRRADLVVRLPAENLSRVLEQVRGLGRVLHEQLSTDEVTDRVIDLEARLRNARATEQRLIAVLNERTGKVRDILEVEREIARTREEVERMEAQRLNLLNRVQLATVTVTLTEEFKAQLQPTPAGTGTRLRNAFVEGYENFVGMLLGFLLFFARYWLTLLFWGGLGWLGWRWTRRPVLRLLRP